MSLVQKIPNRPVSAGGYFMEFIKVILGRENMR
jgi:hypothetical protein